MTERERFLLAASMTYICHSREGNCPMYPQHCPFGFYGFVDECESVTVQHWLDWMDDTAVHRPQEGGK